MAPPSLTKQHWDILHQKLVTLLSGRQQKAAEIRPPWEEGGGLGDMRYQ